ncbi:carbohydrate-binding protein [Streptomyces sp. NPDC020707]|uniref:carbohydrate-binding protein n=1 Tax=Streptomyces sp. NPDC020707 TaxID=3365084 RepID=UPI0037976E0E
MVYRACDFGSGAPGTRSGASSGTRSVTVEVSGEGTLELALDDGEMIAHLDIAPTAGPYAYASVTTPFDASGVHDLRIELRGPLRLAHVGFAGPLPPGP